MEKKRKKSLFDFGFGRKVPKTSGNTAGPLTDATAGWTETGVHGEDATVTSTSACVEGASGTSMTTTDKDHVVTKTSTARGESASTTAGKDVVVTKTSTARGESASTTAGKDVVVTKTSTARGKSASTTAGKDVVVTKTSTARGESASTTAGKDVVVTKTSTARGESASTTAGKDVVVTKTSTARGESASTTAGKDVVVTKTSTARGKSASTTAGKGNDQVHAEGIETLSVSKAQSSAPRDQQMPIDITDSEQPSSSSSSSRTSAPNKPLTDEECSVLVKTLFETTKTVHNRYSCSERFCSDISGDEKKRLRPKKFNHSKLTDYWWLVFVEGEGMYCMLCKKQKVKHLLNKRDIFVNTPGTRFLEDALKVHSASSVHKSAIEVELVQKMSIFHREVCQKDHVEVSLYQKVFSTAYFMMQNFIANRKLTPLLHLIETTWECSDLKYFQHKSAGSLQEIFITLGDTVKGMLLEKIKKAECFGVLADEVSDISVTEHLITFVQYFDKDASQVQTSLLSCQDVLEEFSSANADSLTALLLDTMQSNGLKPEKMTGFASDGAAVMMGRKGGVAAQLRKHSPTMINIHCVCHKLALSCTDTNESLKYIKEVETILRQLWTFFENSPKRMAAFLKMQLELKNVHASNTASSKVATRLKKACRTRWLSLDASVKAVFSEFEAILQTLAQFEADATAVGLLKKMKSIKFLGVIYILREVLPILSSLSKAFQRDSLNFSAITPQVNATKERLDLILQNETPLLQLQSDIDSFTNMCSEITLSRNHITEMQTLFTRYIHGLKLNLDKRFSDNSEVVAAFSVFDPLTVPNQGEDGFQQYGVDEMTVLGSHYFQDQKDIQEQLLVEWRGMKYHLKDVIKHKVPHSVKEGSSKVASTEWCLVHILSVPAYKQFFPKLTTIAESAASLPVTNAWPERGASALKNIKTRHRNRIKNNMLEAILQVTINGPQSSSPNTEEVIQLAVNNWMQAKSRNKLAKKAAQSSERRVPRCVDAGSQTEPVVISDHAEVREEIQAIMKQLAIEGLPEDESASDDSDCDI